ncbi:ABC-type multidrug transport system ATPase subunit [Pullulanibacillus pueri]|uniref:ABC transporter ATP-binding protein n=1 Tax=Pullulanibacillus pueri TaxID=1437324 RepID=A0A8J2ZU84_9BACL|nr:ABC-type multidrug transport system ATPase subunit [Pullulanibacillus pueri]GGH76825.1 hypothetical protein GCM10007096_07810 [Pullulanibacillus pueri]
MCDHGATVFLTIHILGIAERMCDRIAIINDGSVIALRTMEELRGQKGAQTTREAIFTYSSKKRFGSSLLRR